MTTRPAAAVRRQVVARAGDRCEYCQAPQELVASAHQVDHFIAEKHGGKTALENLALSCSLYNRRKGSDIASMDPETGRVSSLFNPRADRWSDHFELDGRRIVGLTPAGRATVMLLQLNSFERMMERGEWMDARRFPPA